MSSTTLEVTPMLLANNKNGDRKFPESKIKSLQSYQVHLCQAVLGCSGAGIMFTMFVILVQLFGMQK